MGPVTRGARDGNFRGVGTTTDVYTKGSPTSGKSQAVEAHGDQECEPDPCTEVPAEATVCCEFAVGVQLVRSFRGSPRATITGQIQRRHNPHYKNPDMPGWSATFMLPLVQQK
jgi:hypothetical protein